MQTLTEAEWAVRVLGEWRSDTEGVNRPSGFQPDRGRALPGAGLERREVASRAEFRHLALDLGRAAGERRRRRDALRPGGGDSHLSPRVRPHSAPADPRCLRLESGDTSRFANICPATKDERAKIGCGPMQYGRGEYWEFERSRALSWRSLVVLRVGILLSASDGRLARERTRP